MKGTPQGFLRRFWLASLAAVVLSLMASASPSNAAVTLGQMPPGSSPITTCNLGPQDIAQPGVSSGNSYVVPATGGISNWTVTSWSHNAAAGGNQTLTMKFFRHITALTYMAVGHDGPHNLTGATLNTFPASVAVKAGDVLGLNDEDASTVNNACLFSTGMAGDRIYRTGNLADGQSNVFTDAMDTFRPNITAVITPTNTFTLGNVDRNKKRGTATLEVNVPNDGNLNVSGNGVKATAAATSTTAVKAGTVSLRIKAKGKKRKRLNERGKVKLNLGFTYTPTGGDPSAQDKRVKLKKRV